MSKKLLTSITKKDFEIQTFRAGGKGGQHQNKCDSGVRIIHKDSGARGESREERSQYQNKRKALKRLTEDPKFKIWINKLAFGIDNLEKKIKQQVEESMKDSNLKIEVFKDRKWQHITSRLT